MGELDIQPLDFKTFYQYTILTWILHTKYEILSYFLQPLNHLRGRWRVGGGGLTAMEEENSCGFTTFSF